jgi:hypothetical protein
VRFGGDAGLGSLPKQLGQQRLGGIELRRTYQLPGVCDAALEAMLLLRGDVQRQVPQ